MNSKNIALVRATNIIPFDGTVYPISETPYLKKEFYTEFYYAMYDLLKRNNILKEMDFSRMDEISKENSRIVSQYMPYNSDYNSMVLWSLNGLVPDDINNTFSDKTCAIIENLAEQIDKSRIISLVPTDTAIKGPVHLSDNSTILIKRERFERLSPKEKYQLSKLNLNIYIFDGDLKEAIDKALIKDGRYVPETLSLRREDKGYVKSNTSDELIETINNIANEKDIPQVLFFNIVTKQNDYMDKLSDVENEIQNSQIINEFYRKTFFEYLFSKMNIDDNIKESILNNNNNAKNYEILCEEINKIGLDKYKSIVNEYNRSLEYLREIGKLPTPQEIIDSNNQIDLLPSIIKSNIQDER